VFICSLFRGVVGFGGLWVAGIFFGLAGSNDGYKSISLTTSNAPNSMKLDEIFGIGYRGSEDELSRCIARQGGLMIAGNYMVN
jgi:hypothetical protein